MTCPGPPATHEEVRRTQMRRPRMTRTDLVLTALSVTIEAGLLGWWLNRRWFCD